MGIGAVLTKFTFSFLLPEFADLSLVVIVLDIHHFENKFRGKGLKNTEIKYLWMIVNSLNGF